MPHFLRRQGLLGDSRIWSISESTIAREGSPDPVPHNIAEHRRIWRSGQSEENGWAHCFSANALGKETTYL